MALKSNEMPIQQNTYLFLDIWQFDTFIGKEIKLPFKDILTMKESQRCRLTSGNCFSSCQHLRFIFEVIKENLGLIQLFIDMIVNVIDRTGPKTEHTL